MNHNIFFYYLLYDKTLWYHKTAEDPILNNLFIFLLKSDL